MCPRMRWLNCPAHNRKKSIPQNLEEQRYGTGVTRQTIQLAANNFKWAAQTIAAPYKARWGIEMFFRGIKKLPHIKTFIGTSENAVMIRIWTALITILLLKTIKMQTKYAWRLSDLVVFTRLDIFVKIELQKWSDKPVEDPLTKTDNPQQGVLFQNFNENPLIFS